jgi:diguanylate cyclase (GGDEF)-like protein/PAS domain S-box-containing protein
VPRNILLIQDDESDAKLVIDALAISRDCAFRVVWVRSGTLGLRRLQAQGKQHQKATTGIAAVLLDLSGNEAFGLGIIDRIHAAAPHIPVVVLSSAADQAVARSAMQHGAEDFLLKERLDDYVLEKMLTAVIDRACIAEALFNERERAQVTLNSIGDAVISTDVEGRIAYVNVVAERLTGWRSVDALGRPLEEVFKIIDPDTRQTLQNPVKMATAANQTVGLPPACILVRRDGTEAAIEDSTAPIHDRSGQVTGAVMVFHDVSVARALTLKLAHVAQHDTLTDLPNRALFNDRLHQAIALAQRHRSALAVLYLDLDRFKNINDSLGHLVGDRLLQSVARRLSEGVRTSDTVCRLGGDEFVILLPEVAHAHDAAVCAEKLLQALRSPYVMDADELHITASIGIAVFPGDGAEVEALLQNADSAMYEAKDRGRNSYQFYRPELNSGATARQSLELGLRRALERHELQLHYQPIMNVTSGAIAGVEALIRWNHPTLGLLLPVQFIGIAEESGLIVPIGQWVLREACNQAKAWQEAGLTLSRLAVNISAVELRSSGFVAGVSRILEESGLDARCLELELTETFLMQDSKSTAVVLDALKELGARLALDDFGTGYSSLSYMRRFPIDTLKIDQSFVRDLSSDPDDASIVNAVINMAKSLHMRVVAEGVETRSQRSFLRKNGCFEAQGYFFSRPLTSTECAELLRSASLTLSKPAPSPATGTKRLAHARHRASDDQQQQRNDDAREQQPPGKGRPSLPREGDP